MLTWATTAGAWGFFAHRLINQQAVYLLPPEMMLLFKPHIGFLTEHATDPDSRRYIVQAEGPRHYIDLDRYGVYPFSGLPRNWNSALEKFGADSLNAHGIVPWWIQTMLFRLTGAFREKNQSRILKLSAEIGHYIADGHVPLHACSNHNGQYTDQHGIHGFWESRVPELLAMQEWDFIVGKAQYISDPPGYTWKFILESAAAADTVLKAEAFLSKQWPQDQKYAWEPRNGILIRQYSRSFTEMYNRHLDGMVERRLRQSILSVASFWLTAWINAGQPNLSELAGKSFSEAELQEFLQLNEAWKKSIIGKSCD